jgi:Spy/CpxP family protein refolding chaperone
MRAVRVLALGAAMVIGTGGVAFAQQTDSSARPRAEQQRDGQRRAERGDRRRGPRGKGIARALFRGIELSADQRTRVQQIGEKYRTERTQLRERARAGVPAGQRPDSAQRASMRASAQQLMARQRAEVRGVLTAEQQATFDRNVQEIEKRMSERRERGGRRGGGRPGATSGG